MNLDSPLVRTVGLIGTFKGYFYVVCTSDDNFMRVLLCMNFAFFFVGISFGSSITSARQSYRHSLFVLFIH